MTLKARGILGTLLIPLGLAACAGHSDESNGSGGVANTAGSSGNGASGAGGNLHALPAQGAVTASVGQPTVHVDQMTCPAIQTYQVGAPQAPTATDPGESVVSGDAGASISCTVKGNGTFSFSGSLHAPTGTGDLVSIVFSNGTVAPDFTGTADITFYTPQLSANFNSAAPCAINVLGQQVKAGSIWASFNCPMIESPPSGLCGLTGTIVFENCAGT
jgi:hypothetical protein